ncbi:MAG: FAD-binding protein [Synergistaceae bacterium]|nr:FAD-binding protein [Synergistaceae bacterium]
MKAQVVVIGSGGAGLVAAIAAKRSGADVWLVSKTKRSLGTCTAYAGGIFSLACGDVSSREHFEKTMETGKHLNDSDLVRVLSEEAEGVLRELIRWGVNIKLENGRASVLSSAPSLIMGGAGFLDELISVAEGSGVKFLDWTVVTSIRVSMGRVTGINIQNWQTGEEGSIDTGSVILATGGGGQIYSHTDNPARITGDGYALALKAGAVLRDMEFVQFYPLGWAEPGFPRWLVDLSLVDSVRVTDSRGDEFLKETLRDWGYKDGKEGNLYARDRSARLVAQKDREGGVYAHLEDLTEEMLKDPDMQYCLGMDISFFKDIRRPFRLTPLEHYFCGGVVIDSFGRTAVDGLYACGEVTGGVDGANRVGGNALSNIVVFGYRAGITAAKEGRRTTGPGGLPPSGYLHEVSEDNGQDPLALRKELQEETWKALGPIRRTVEMERYLDLLSDFRTRKVRIKNPLGRLQVLEMQGLYETAKAVAQAALKRKESLGTHWRED